MDKDAILKEAEEKAKEILLPALKLYGQYLIKDVVMGALEEVVADSSNPYDDMILAAIEPVIDAKMKDLLGE